MIKTTGMIMMIIFASLTGESFAQKHMTLYKKLSDTCTMLTTVKSLINSESMTVADILSFLHGKQEYSYIPFLCDQGSVPDRSYICKELEAHPFFFEPELDSRLQRTFSFLGTTDKPSQLEMLCDAISFFEEKRREKALELPKKKRLCRSLGVISGAFAAVLLM